MKRIIQICGAMILAIMAVGMLLFLVFPGSIMKNVHRGCRYCQRRGFGPAHYKLWLCGLRCERGLFRRLEAWGKGFASFLISLLRYLALIVPAAYLGIRIAGVIGIWTDFLRRKP